MFNVLVTIHRCFPCTLALLNSLSYMGGSVVFEFFGEQSNYHFVHSSELHLPEPLLNLWCSDKAITGHYH